MRLNRFITTAFALTALAAPASAHTGLGTTNGLSAGFLHPVSGIDHMTVMIAVGIFATQLAPRALYLVPLTFMGVMVIGAGLGMAGISLPFVEAVIAFSVLAMGVAVAMGWRLPLAAAMALVGTFAVFHGYSHGAEMPLEASGYAYGAGFVLATGLLHLIGIGLGLAMLKLPRLQRAIGVVAAAIGVGLLAGWV